MHNTIHRKPATTPTSRDAAIQILGASVNVVVNETFTQALEARIRYAKGIVRAVIGDDEEGDWMVGEAIGIAEVLGAIAYRSNINAIPAMFEGAKLLNHAWQAGYYDAANSDNSDF